MRVRVVTPTKHFYTYVDWDDELVITYSADGVDLMRLPLFWSTSVSSIMPLPPHHGLPEAERTLRLPSGGWPPLP